MKDDKIKVKKRLSATIYADGKTPKKVAHKMAVIKLENSKDELTSEKYNEDISTLENNYESYISKYNSGKHKKPNAEIFDLIQKATGWSDEKLEFALSPEEGVFQTDYVYNTGTIGGERLYQNFNSNIIYAFPPNRHQNRIPVSVGMLPLSQSSLEDKNPEKSELAFTQQISTQVDNNFQEINKNTTDQISEEKRLVTEDFKFEIIRLHVVAVYCSDNCMDSSKYFEIKSLVDNLESIESFDCYHLVRDERNVYLNGSKCVEVKKVYEPEGELNFINLAFKESLVKGQKRIFNVDLSAQKVLKYDTKFHSTWIRHLTKQLKMSITPPNPSKGMKAKVWEYRNKSERSHKRGTHLADLCLDESLIFEWEMADPVLNHIYEIRWED